MAGPLIVEGDLDALPGIAGVPERLLVLQATQLYPDGGSVQSITNVPGPPTDGPVMQKKYLRLVNGQLNPTMTIRPGETQRWRILNASPNVTYLLHLDGHQLHQIAKDGNTLNETWTREAIVLSPGERVEVLVQAGPAGTYALRTLPIATGINTQKDPTLATLVVDGDRRDAAAAADDAAAARGPLDRRDRPAPPDHLPVRAADRSARGHLLDRPPGLRWRPRRSGRPAQHDRGVGDPQRHHPWHPFHIHINPYQVVAVNGQPVPVRYNEDTTAVPPFGEITIRTRFLDFPGRWVYHCHILLHEDNGMMGTVRALA